MIFLQSCTKGQKLDNVDATSILIPYSLKQDSSKFLSLVDDSMPKDALGNTLVDVYLDKKRNITGSNVIFLKIKSQDSIIVNHLNYESEVVALVEYPEQIRQIVAQLKEYAEALPVVQVYKDNTGLESFLVHVPRSIKIE